MEFSSCRWVLVRLRCSVKVLNSALCCSGKGIADQDRNVLSNQLLILAFLRSVADMLITGPIPTILKPRKKKSNDDDDDDDEADYGMKQDQRDEDESIPYLDPETVEKTRGTVLITLRNVSPYTLW